ncbi:MAG: dephospho-CoA kinase [Ignavibacteriales bacterium]
MYKVGLTGGIASGKSTVSRFLQEMGAVIIDADEVARQIVEPGQPALQEIAREFGPEIIGPDGRMDRAKLGDMVFRDPALRLKLNAITHPRWSEMFKIRMSELPPDTKIVFWDVPLLFETGTDKVVDEVWLVWIDEATQVKRLMARNNYTEEEALIRIRSQMLMAEKRDRADVLIDNRGSIEETKRAVTKFYNHLLRILEKQTI